MISDADLLLQVRSTDSAVIPELRRLEKAAIAHIENRTGKYFGAAQEDYIEYLSWRGWPMPIANNPEEISLLESWDGTAWTEVDPSSYSYANGYIWWNSTASWSPLTMPTRYRATYDTGYEVDQSDDDVWAAPDDIRQAVLLLVGHWYENREAVVAEHISSVIELGVDALISGHIRVAV